MKKFPTTTATPLETAEWNKSFLYEFEKKKHTTQHNKKKERQIVKNFRIKKRKVKTKKMEKRKRRRRME